LNFQITCPFKWANRVPFESNYCRTVSNEVFNVLRISDPFRYSKIEISGFIYPVAVEKK
jgi:hypothetical protein